MEVIVSMEKAGNSKQIVGAAYFPAMDRDAAICTVVEIDGRGFSNLIAAGTCPPPFASIFPHDMSGKGRVTA